MHPQISFIRRFPAAPIESADHLAHVALCRIAMPMRKPLVIRAGDGWKQRNHQGTQQ